MTASGTFQSKILESLCLLISFEEFHHIRPSVLNIQFFFFFCLLLLMPPFFFLSSPLLLCSSIIIFDAILEDLIDFLVHFQTIGDLNFVNQTLCEKCTKVLHSQTTKGFSDSLPIPPADYPSESCCILI